MLPGKYQPLRSLSAANRSIRNSFASSDIGRAVLDGFLDRLDRFVPCTKTAALAEMCGTLCLPVALPEHDEPLGLYCLAVFEKGVGADLHLCLQGQAGLAYGGECIEAIYVCQSYFYK